MAIDFFGAQDQARRNTGLLVVLFFCAVFLLVLLTNVLVCFGFNLINVDLIRSAYQQNGDIPWHFLPYKTIVPTSLGVIGGIALMVTIKWVSLRAGGRAVAESLGGERVTYSNATGQQQVLLNVVAEMAIAANVPMPPVYVLPESAINAFAAGYSPADAVIGVTQGCLSQLNRDELQGVIAHEFSHILNGDMRLNIRLMAWLFGIVCIAQTGRFILDHSRGLRTSDDKKSNPLPLIGLGLLLIGYIGVFFGNLIKAAVSRQREFLADASAVQFTRNPQGIAGALKKIAVYSQHGELETAGAESASHLFFSAALTHFFGWMSTHPPLTLRIQRIDPSWDGRFAVTHAKTRPAAASSAEAASMPTANLAGEHAEFASAVFGLASHQSAAQQLPEFLLASCRRVPSATALYLATLLQSEHLARQMFLIRELGNQELLVWVDQLSDPVQNLPRQQQLQLLQLTIPTLKEQTASQFKLFQHLVHELVQTDQQQDLFEWIIQTWLLHCVAVHWQWAEISATVRSDVLAKRQSEVLCLLSVVCAYGNAESPLRQLAWQAGLAQLGLELDTPNPEATMAELSEAMRALLGCGPELKRKIWHMLKAAIFADDLVNPEEQLLLQAFALLLEMPLPQQSAFAPS